MPDQQPHKPTMDQIRNDFIEAWSGHFMDGSLGAAEYFDQALNAHNARIKADAEQSALREAAIEIAICDGSTARGIIKSNRDSIVRWLKKRADRIANKEGDDA